MNEPIKTLVSLIFPPRCAACREILTYDSDSLLCDNCAEKWNEEILSHCSLCGHLVSECTCVHDRCKHTVAKLCSVSAYTGSHSVTDNLVLAAKDYNDRKLFAFMSEKMTEIARSSLESVNGLLVTYVPRSKSARREKGHDQSEILASMIAESLGAEMKCLFKKKGNRQQKTLGANERSINAQSSYFLIDKCADSVKGRNILLCDDVVTTGASLSVCARQLVDAGAGKVYALTFAKTVKISKEQNKIKKERNKIKKS